MFKNLIKIFCLTSLLFIPSITYSTDTRTDLEQYVEKFEEGTVENYDWGYIQLNKVKRYEIVKYKELWGLLIIYDAIDYHKETETYHRGDLNRIYIVKDGKFYFYRQRWKNISSAYKKI